jgi:hypothetical protein
LEIEHQGQVIKLQGLTAANAQRQRAALSDMPSQTNDTSEDHWIRVCQVEADNSDTVSSITQRLL